MEETVFKLMENANDVVMIPTDANLFILELWEILLIVGGMFVLGSVMGTYITSQISRCIQKKIE